jgi:hypothetical protein
MRNRETTTERTPNGERRKKGSEDEVEWRRG